ncbi:MAG: hypothetical protein ACFBSG_10605 [Leptolyngbyaceae cyanobacterium]
MGPAWFDRAATQPSDLVVQSGGDALISGLGTSILLLDRYAELTGMRRYRCVIQRFMVALR